MRPRRVRDDSLGARLRLAALLFVPSFAAAFALVRQAWLAYVATLSESELHLRVFDHAAAVSVVLIGSSLLLAALVALAVARLIDLRRRKPAGYKHVEDS